MKIDYFEKRKTDSLSQRGNKKKKEFEKSKVFF